MKDKDDKELKVGDTVIFLYWSDRVCMGIIEKFTASKVYIRRISVGYNTRIIGDNIVNTIMPSKLRKYTTIEKLDRDRPERIMKLEPDERILSNIYIKGINKTKC